MIDTKSPAHHSLLAETSFHVKSMLLMAKRRLRNVLDPDIKKFSDQGKLITADIISVSESELWNADDNKQNWVLTAGKVQNLRIAAQKLKGLEVPGGQVFSFWKHIGNPNFNQGYVVGREIREGCIVPTVAGGLCQLSNALYDAALNAGFEILERHRHSRIIKGSLAEKDRDATVKWNYIDLRFRARTSFRIEAELSSEKLIVKFRSYGGMRNSENSNAAGKPASVLNDCYSCGNSDCFRHPGITPVKKEEEVTTFILDEKWKEYDQYIQSTAKKHDHFIVPLLKNSILKSARYAWNIPDTKNATAVPMQVLKRSVNSRLFAKSGGNVFSTMLRMDEKMANAFSKKIPIESTHLVVSQNLLPFLMANGALGGRTYDVLMNRLPMEKLHERLNLAHSKYRESKTLNDFRAGAQLVELETLALARSRRIITPHREIAAIFNNKSIQLNWSYPVKKGLRETPKGNKILFPGSALGRKGAYEMKKLAEELHLSFLITGKAEEDKNFWGNVKTEIAGPHPFDQVWLVIYPAYVENQPRLLLKAIAAGLPVIATEACGLQPMLNLTIVPTGDYNALKKAVTDALIRPGQPELSTDEVQIGNIAI
jgi:hypothetical protein